MREWRKKNPEREKELQRQGNERRKKYFADYFQKNKERVREQRQQHYLQNKDYYRQKAREHYERNRERILREGREERLEVVKAYGGKCICCGETEIKFLALDHKNNDGARHRKEIGLWGGKMYRWAKKNNYPNLLQVLCHNCNLAKAFHGKCPHQKRENTA